MNINFNIRNNNKHLILLFIVSVVSAIGFLASYNNIQSVFANSQISMKDQMNNMTTMQNQNMTMVSSQMQKMMMEQMNKTGMMMGPMIGMRPMMMMDLNQMQKMMME